MNPEPDYSERAWRYLLEAIILAPANLLLYMDQDRGPFLGKWLVDLIFSAAPPLTEVTDQIQVVLAPERNPLEESDQLLAAIKQLAAVKYQDNRLIQRLMADLNQLPPIDTSFMGYDNNLTVIRAAGQVINQSSSRETEEYKRFLLDLTEMLAVVAAERGLDRNGELRGAKIRYMQLLKNILRFDLE